MKYINKKNVLFLGAFFVILLLTLSFERDYIFKIFDSNPNLDESQVSNQKEENDSSPFGDYITGNGNGISGGGGYPPKVQQNFEVSAKFLRSLEINGYVEWEKNTF